MADPFLFMADDHAGDLYLLDLALRAVRPQAMRMAVAHDGAEAWEMLQACGAEGKPPRLVVLDLHLPLLSGTEVAGRLRADPRLRAIPTILVSSGAVPTHDPTLCDACFEKPGCWADYLDFARLLERHYLDDRIGG